jgi:NAD(P)-dependent dehydrogenase (short-subunit alcohol dehydrogenase family)
VARPLPYPAAPASSRKPDRQPRVDRPSRTKHRRRLANLVVIITGAGRGIGRATAELFAREGARLVLCSRTDHELRAVLRATKASGGEAVARVTDISRPRQAQALVRMAVRRYGRLDLLINNAGILGPRVPIADYPVRDWDLVLRINLSGTFYLSQEAATCMVQQGRGCIILISSSVGRAGRAGWGAYAVSKFGVEGLCQVMADELKPFGVTVVTFNPGGTRTTMRAQAYPHEDRRKLHAPSVPAEALLRLALCLSSSMSGKAFDLHNLP